MHAESGAPAFRNVALAYALGQVADWLVEVTLALVVFERTGSALAAALVFVAVRVLPVGGMRWAAGRSLGGLAALRVLAVAALALGAGSLPVWGLLALGVLDGFGSLGGRAGSRAAAVRLLGNGDALRAGNATLNLAFSAAAMATPGAAGLIVSKYGGGTALAVAAVAVAAAAATVRRVRVAAPAERTARTGLLRTLRESGSAGWLGVEVVLLVLFTAAVPVELPYVLESLGAGDRGYGALLTAWGAGMVAGSLAFALLRRAELPVLAAGSTLAVAAAYLVMGMAPSLAFAVAGAFLGGAGNGVHWVSAVSWIQRRAPRSLAAPVAALLESVAALAPGAGFLAGGLAVALLDPRACLIGGALLVAFVTLAAGAVAAWPRRPLGARLRTRLEPVCQPLSYVEPTPLGREPYSG